MIDHLVELTKEQQKIADIVCEEIFELGVNCHRSDKHVVEKMIQQGYRKINNGPLTTNKNAYEKSKFPNEAYDFNITIRAARVLASIGINSEDDLIGSSIDYDYLIKIASCGKKTACEIVSYKGFLRGKP